MNIIKKIFKKSFSDSELPEVDIAAIQNATPVQKKKLIFSFGTGRGGQRWMTKILQSHSNCQGNCERFPTEESFYRYALWYNLPVDFSGFYKLVEQSIYYDWSTADISVNASPYYCFGVDQLVKRFSPDLLFLHLRRPEMLVNSFFVKGWYVGGIDYDNNKILSHGPQVENVGSFAHNFGRIFPKNDFLDEWKNMTSIGRIAWYCSNVITAINDSFEKNSHIMQWNIRLEDVDQNYEFYRQMVEELNLEPVMGKKEYLSLKGKIRNRGKKRRSFRDWTDKEKSDFEKSIGPYIELYDSVKPPF